MKSWCNCKLQVPSENTRADGWARIRRIVVVLVSWILKLHGYKMLATCSVLTHLRAFRLELICQGPELLEEKVGWLPFDSPLLPTKQPESRGWTFLISNRLRHSLWQEYQISCSSVPKGKCEKRETSPTVFNPVENATRHTWWYTEFISNRYFLF